MINIILKKIFGTESERILKEIQPIVDKINSLEPTISNLSDNELKAKTEYFRNKITSGEKLDSILPEAFAVVREVGKRVINMRHFDVQLAGGIVLHRGMIAEMATGEGKTLVATLPVYLNALTGRGVHVITVNDYLARRDRDWMGPIYEFLGFSIGVIQHGIDEDARKQAYSCDITYGTNNEFGFDYLRDNMRFHSQAKVQREFHYAIVDEVDSILIDEARTPLIISGPAEESTDKYYKIDKIIPRLKAGKKDDITKEETGDYIVDEKGHTAYLTDKGEVAAAKFLELDNLHDTDTMEYKHHVNQALMAHALYKKDKDYLVKDNQVVIVDEFTGRMMPGRRWSDGLHQAVEAKEGVKIERENQTLATVTFQNYFRMYEKLAGMTGTAETEAVEFQKIYKLKPVVVPTNKPLMRTNHPDVIYKTEKEKFKALCDEIAELNRIKRPVLVGTISIEKNEFLSSMLKKRGIQHHVLNAKYHEMEAHIITQAGRLGAVTVATNMAGRGTDIVLGGNPEYMTRDMVDKLKTQGRVISEEEYKQFFEENTKLAEKEHSEVVKLGGLHVIGSERHEARRIDNQLRGRAGRQGDPGSSRFYLSLKDDLMRVFGSDRVASMMDRLGMEEGQEIQHPFISRAVETAQKRVEERNFEIRKHLLEFDNVMNKQREVIYEERSRVLIGKDLKSHIYEVIEETLERGMSVYLNKEVPKEDWDIAGFIHWIRSKFAIDISELKLQDELYETSFSEVLKKVKVAYAHKEDSIGEDTLRHLEKVIMLQMIDSKWKDHLRNMDELRRGIGLRAYGQRDPLVEYQHEGYNMFTAMIDSIKDESVELAFRVQPAKKEQSQHGIFDFSQQELIHQEKFAFEDREKEEKKSFSPTKNKITPHQRQVSKVGRNEPCPCGSGKKYKKCCGK